MLKCSAADYSDIQILTRSQQFNTPEYQAEVRTKCGVSLACVDVL